MGQSFVIENVDGAAGQIGGEPRREGGARRLHDRRVQRQHHDDAAQHRRLICRGTSSRTSHRCRWSPRSTGGSLTSPGFVVQDGGRRDRRGHAAQPDKHRLRLGRHRQSAARGDGAVHCRRPASQMNARPVQGRVAGGDRGSRVATSTVAFEGLATVTSLIAGKRVKLIAVSTRRTEDPAVPRRADRSRTPDLPGFQLRVVVHDDGAGQHAEADRRSPAGRGREGVEGPGRDRPASSRSR